MVLCADRAAHATQEYILPTLLDVTGVEAGDVLSIRAAPSARAEIIGMLDYDARDIEVVAHDRTGHWAEVNTDERTGWAPSYPGRCGRRTIADAARSAPLAMQFEAILPCCAGSRGIYCRTR